MFMSAELKHRLNYEIMIAEHAREAYVMRLDALQDSNKVLLRRTKRHNNEYYYYEKPPGSKAFVYIGRKSHSRVKRIQEARFLTEAICRIEQDLVLMKALADGYIPYDPSSVNECLPMTYRCEVAPVSELYERESAKWKANRLEYQKKFPENYPENKRHTTTDGIKVKTISELTLYEMFKSAGLALVYELPLAMKDHGPPLYPDFTILSPVDMKSEIIVEFAGRLDLWSYSKDFGERVSRYINNGYNPGVNLFFVFGDRDGNIDSTQITKVIADILGIRSGISL